MRIVAVADTHTFTEKFEVPDGDVFIHAGDICRGGDLDELRDAADWMAGLPHRHKIVVAGNHDWAFVHEPAAARGLLGDMHYLQDREVLIEWHTVLRQPVAARVQRVGVQPPARTRARQGLVEDPGGPRRADHARPTRGHRRSLGPYGGRTGCADLLRRVGEVAPRLHMYGHIHQDGGAWQRGPTLYANVTAWECERAARRCSISTHAQVSVVEVPPHGRRDDDDQTW